MIINNKIYNYTVYLKSKLALDPDFMKALGDHLYNQLDKSKTIKIKHLVIERSNEPIPTKVIIMLESELPTSILLQEINRIKKYTPVSLQTKKVIPKVIPIFSKYKGKMTCKYHRDKDKCPGKSNCHLKDDHGTLLCNSNTNLNQLTDSHMIENQNQYLDLKKRLPTTLYYRNQ